VGFNLNILFCRSPIFYYLRDMLGNVCKNIPDLSQQARKECDLWEYTFKEPSLIDLTEVCSIF